MVTPTEPQSVEQTTFLDQADPDVDVALPASSDMADLDTPDTTEDTPGEPAAIGSTPAPVGAAPVGSPEPQAPPVEPKVLQELQQRRAAEAEQQWRSQVGQAARQYRENLVSQQGYTPAMADDQARRYVQQEQKFRQQETESAELLGFIEGRQMAALHYLEKEGLADKQMIADYRALQQANSPAEMEKEAKRMKQERSLRAENAQLKQGRVSPQTFDNSQGAAEASSNDQRLLDAYINGDRSEAAVRAARRLSIGS
jgi:hypothetical protein